MKQRKIKRVLIAPENDKESFSLYKPILLKLFPDMASFLDEMEKKLNDSSCKGCAKRQWFNRLKKEISNRPLPAKKELEALTPLLGETFMHSLYTKQPSFEKVHIISSSRPACPDCCRKHLAQAIILVNESFMGYPEHSEMALAHLREAAEEIIELDKEFAESIYEEHNEFDADRNYYPDLMPLLKTAIKLISEG